MSRSTKTMALLALLCTGASAGYLRQGVGEQRPKRAGDVECEITSSTTCWIFSGDERHPGPEIQSLNDLDENKVASDAAWYFFNTDMTQTENLLLYVPGMPDAPIDVALGEGQLLNPRTQVYTIQEDVTQPAKPEWTASASLAGGLGGRAEDFTLTEYVGWITRVKTQVIQTTITTVYTTPVGCARWIDLKELWVINPYSEAPLVDPKKLFAKPALY